MAYARRGVAAKAAEGKVEGAESDLPGAGETLTRRVSGGDTFSRENRPTRIRHENGRSKNPRPKSWKRRSSLRLPQCTKLPYCPARDVFGARVGHRTRGRWP